MTGHKTSIVPPENGDGPIIRENDVLLGRGGQTNKHVGNKRYRSIVVDHQHEYLRARKKDKIVIARRIVAIIHQNGGRFLKQIPSSLWEEVTDERAQAKTSQALREGLDVRNRMQRHSKMPLRDSESCSEDSPPRKRVKTTNSHFEATASTAPSLVSVDGNGGELHLEDHQECPKATSFINYQRQLSKSDVTDACAV